MYQYASFSREWDRLCLRCCDYVRGRRWVNLRHHILQEPHSSWRLVDKESVRPFVPSALILRSTWLIACHTKQFVLMANRAPEEGHGDGEYCHEHAKDGRWCVQQVVEEGRGKWAGIELRERLKRRNERHLLAL